MTKSEFRIDRSTGIVPTPSEIRAITSIEAIDECEEGFDADDRETMEHLTSLGIIPYSTMMKVACLAGLAMETAIDPPDVSNFTKEEDLEYCAALMAGRIKNPDETDKRILDQFFFESLVRNIIDRNFGGHPELFDPEQISSLQYAEMIRELGEDLVENAGEPLPYDDPEGDKDVADFIACLGDITLMGLASGSRKAMLLAKEYIDKIEKKVAPRSSVVQDEAVALEKQIREIILGKTDPSELKNFKEGLEGDWSEILNTYTTWGLTIGCRKSLEVVCHRDFDHRSAGGVKKIIQMRMLLFRDFMLLEQRRTELLSGNVGDLEDILDTNEMFSQLDWTVLPRGEQELEKAAREIVADAQERHSKGVEIDIRLDRLNILKNVKENWGVDRAYYARGTLSGRGKVSVNGEERPDEYIVLVLQELDSDGQVICEHAVAESPVAGHNAMYVLRGDVTTKESWRKVYSLPKKYARQLSARQVKHTKGDGSPEVDVLTDRVTYLLSCSPEEFSEITFCKDRVRVTCRLGKMATSAHTVQDN